MFTEGPDDATNEILDVCERLERMQPELGSSRVADSESVIRGQTATIELVAGRVCEEVLHADYETLGAQDDEIEAAAFARVVVAAQPAVTALIEYCEAEARALLTQNIMVVRALVEGLIESGTMTGDEVDEIIVREIAREAMAKEVSRRVEWRERERNARAFVESL